MTGHPARVRGQGWPIPMGLCCVAGCIFGTRRKATFHAPFLPVPTGDMLTYTRRALPPLWHPWTSPHAPLLLTSTEVFSSRDQRCSSVSHRQEVSPQAVGPNNQHPHCIHLLTRENGLNVSKLGQLSRDWKVGVCLVGISFNVKHSTLTSLLFCFYFWQM